MTEALLHQAAEAVRLVILCSAIPLGAALGVGFLVALFQAATQIQEQTLSFVPKIAAAGLALWVGGPGLVEVYSEFLARLYSELVILHAAAG